MCHRGFDNFFLLKITLDFILNLWEQTTSMILENKKTLFNFLNIAISLKSLVLNYRSSKFSQSSRSSNFRASYSLYFIIKFWQQFRNLFYVLPLFWRFLPNFLKIAFNLRKETKLSQFWVKKINRLFDLNKIKLLLSWK